MKLYGAEVSQQYIQTADRKRNPVRYPMSEEYPREAEEHEKWGDAE